MVSNLFPVQAGFVFTLLDEGWEIHDLLEHHPVDHLDIVVSDQPRGSGRGQHGVVHVASHPCVHYLGWGGVVGLARGMYR